MLKHIFVTIPFVVARPITLSLGVWDNGALYITLSAPALFGNITIPFEVSAGNQNRIWFMTSHDDNFEIRETFLEMNVLSGPPIVLESQEVSVVAPAETALSVDMIHIAQIGVNRASLFVQNFGSVDVIRRQKRLVLKNTDFAEFSRNCVEGSAMMISLIPLENYLDFLVSIDLGESAGVLESRGMIGNYHSRKLLDMDRNSLRGFLDIIGTDLTGDDHIRNCSQVRERLPQITITFRNPENLTYGHLVLFPDDYTQMDHGDTCSILIGEGSCRPNTVCFNPLMVPDVNVRFTANELVLCDSRQDA